MMAQAFTPDGPPRNLEVWREKLVGPLAEKENPELAELRETKPEEYESRRVEYEKLFVEGREDAVKRILEDPEAMKIVEQFRPESLKEGEKMDPKTTLIEMQELLRDTHEVLEHKQTFLQKVAEMPVIKQAIGVGKWGLKQVVEHPIRTGLIAAGVIGVILAYNYLSAEMVQNWLARMNFKGVEEAAVSHDIAGDTVAETVGSELPDMPSVGRDVGGPSVPMGESTYEPGILPDTSAGDITPIKEG